MLQDKMGKMEKNGKKIMQPKWPKYQKTKIWDERNKNAEQMGFSRDINLLRELNLKRYFQYRPIFIKMNKNGLTNINLVLKHGKKSVINLLIMRFSHRQPPKFFEIEQANFQIILIIHFYALKWALGRTQRHFMNKFYKWLFFTTSNEIIWSKKPQFSCLGKGKSFWYFFIKADMAHVWCMLYCPNSPWTSLNQFSKALNRH